MLLCQVAIDKLVQGPEERSQCLAAAGRRGDEHVLSLADLGPGFLLDVGRFADLLPEPLLDEWMK